MDYKNLFYGIALIVCGVLLFCFLYYEHIKIKNKTYTPNKEEAKEWPYMDMEEIGDYTDKFTFKKGMIGSLIMIALGIYKIYIFVMN